MDKLIDDSHGVGGGSQVLCSDEPLVAYPAEKLTRNTRRRPNLANLLALQRTMLADLTIGLVIADTRGRLLWHNREAALICTIWRGVSPQGADTLPLTKPRARLPPVLAQECRTFEPNRFGRIRSQSSVTEPERGLYAQFRSHVLDADGDRPPLVFLRLDYRRPREDREQEILPTGLHVLNQLSFREREIALRVRDGLTNQEIARLLRRSPMTIKSQLRSIHRKLGINRRAKLVALLCKP